MSSRHSCSGGAKKTPRPESPPADGESPGCGAGPCCGSQGADEASEAGADPCCGSGHDEAATRGGPCCGTGGPADQPELLTIGPPPADGAAPAPPACPDCGAPAVEVDWAPELRCRDCGRVLPNP